MSSRAVGFSLLLAATMAALLAIDCVNLLTMAVAMVPGIAAAQKSLRGRSTYPLRRHLGKVVPDECNEDSDCCSSLGNCTRHCKLGEHITDKSSLAGWRVGGTCEENWDGFCLEDEECDKGSFCQKGSRTREGTCTFDTFCSKTDCGHGTCLAGRCTCYYGFNGEFCERSTNAFAFLLYGDRTSYLLQSRVLVQSLRAQGAKEDIVAIVPKTLGNSTPIQFLEILKTDGVKIFRPDDVPMPLAMDVDPVIHARWTGVMSKFTVWSMTSYSHVALLDPDIVVDMPSETPGNIFFDCKSPLCAVQDNDRSNLNAGVMVVTPSQDRFSHIVRTLQDERHHFEMPEQMFLTKYANNKMNGLELMFLDQKWNSCAGGGMLFNKGMASSGFNMLHSCTWGTKPPEVRLCITDPKCDPNTERHTVMIFQHHHLRVDPCAHHTEDLCTAGPPAPHGSTCKWCGHYCSDRRIPCSSDVFVQRRVKGDEAVSPTAAITEAVPGSTEHVQHSHEQAVQSCRKQQANQLHQKSTWLDLPSGSSAWPQAAVYQLLTDRFASNEERPCEDLSDYCGGTFRAMKDKLTYLTRLGVDGVAISPVVENMPKGYHGYWPKDLDSVNPQMGTQEELKDMVDQAHQNGIKIIVDVNINHAGYPGMPIEEIPTLKPFSSPEYFHEENCSLWYDEDFDRGKKYVESCRLFGMPDYKHEDPRVWQGLLQWLRRHVDTYGFDGVRVDAAKHIPAAFLSNAAQPMGGPPVPTFYEVVHGDIKVVAAASNTGDYSAVYNYPLYHALRDVFVPGISRMPMTSLAGRMVAMQEDLGGHLSLNFLDNNDLPRFIRLVHGDMALYQNALLALLGSEGVPMLLYGSEQDAQGRAPPSEDPYHMGHDDYRAPLWEDGYNTTGRTFVIIKKLLWLRKKFKGFHQFPAKILHNDHQSLVFSRGPVIFVLTNVGGKKHSVSQRVVWTNSTTRGCEDMKLCDILSQKCLDAVVGMPLWVDVVDGMPRVYVPEDVRHELEQAERVEETKSEQMSKRRLHDGKGWQLVQPHQWTKIQPFPPSVDDIYIAPRSPWAVLPHGVKVNDPPAWDLGPRAPHLDTWNPPIGESTKSARRTTLTNACVYVESQLHVIYLPRPSKTYVLCQNDANCGYMRPQIRMSTNFASLSAGHSAKTQFDGKPVFHLTYAMLFGGVYHLLIEALPSILPHLPALRQGSMRLFVHADQEILSPYLARLGVLDSTFFVPVQRKDQPFHFCAPQLHVELRNNGFFSAERLAHLRRELDLPAGPHPVEKRRDGILVLSRGNSTRALSNEAQLVLALRKLGRPVEVVMPSPENFRTVVEALSRTELVVGAHGANMANLLFAAPGTKVIEVVPQVPFHLANHHFRQLSGALGFSYEPVGQLVEDYDRDLASAPMTQSQAIKSYPVDVERITERVANLLDDRIQP
eukprot:TRINITY_DN2378_c0_g1_i1.p1 TRINITY_DN2378_c0_g1~~TRINITY_DN2378_c0_g1_i1.p1  ORF type:complete len:1426 (-),score=144.48 TRINITY_DN2378_c0_g1_i1:80-4357(-)